MSMRTSSLALLLLVTACGGAPETGGQGKQAADERISCATGGATEFSMECRVEQAASEQGTVLMVSAPDGGFRRLLVASDGRGVVAADGAEPAVVTPVDAHTIEVAIGGDKYRLPATVKPGGSR